MRMLERLQVDTRAYLSQTPVSEMEMHLQNCNACEFKIFCDRDYWPGKPTKVNYSICNNRSFIQSLVDAGAATPSSPRDLQNYVADEPSCRIIVQRLFYFRSNSRGI